MPHFYKIHEDGQVEVSVVMENLSNEAIFFCDLSVPSFKHLFRVKAHKKWKEADDILGAGWIGDEKSRACALKIKPKYNTIEEALKWSNIRTCQLYIYRGEGWWESYKMNESNEYGLLGQYYSPNLAVESHRETKLEPFDQGIY